MGVRPLRPAHDLGRAPRRRGPEHPRRGDAGVARPPAPTALPPEEARAGALHRAALRAGARRSGLPGHLPRGRRRLRRAPPRRHEPPRARERLGDGARGARPARRARRLRRAHRGDQRDLGHDAGGLSRGRRPRRPVADGRLLPPRAPSNGLVDARRPTRRRALLPRRRQPQAVARRPPGPRLATASSPTRSRARCWSSLRRASPTRGAPSTASTCPARPPTRRTPGSTRFATRCPASAPTRTP